MVKLAAVLSIFLGLGFGLPCAYGIGYLSTTGVVWMFLGFPTFGGGPFEGIGIRTTVPLLVAFLVVCGLKVVTGWLLWPRLPTPQWFSLLRGSRSLACGKLLLGLVTARFCKGALAEREGETKR